MAQKSESRGADRRASARRNVSLRGRHSKTIEISISKVELTMKQIVIYVLIFKFNANVVAQLFCDVSYSRDDV